MGADEHGGKKVEPIGIYTMSLWPLQNRRESKKIKNEIQLSQLMTILIIDTNNKSAPKRDDTQTAYLLMAPSAIDKLEECNEDHKTGNNVHHFLLSSIIIITIFYFNCALSRKMMHWLIF
jgi:hypothetical protein